MRSEQPIILDTIEGMYFPLTYSYPYWPLAERPPVGGESQQTKGHDQNGRIHRSQWRMIH